jgi:hypothetical protein
MSYIIDSFVLSLVVDYAVVTMAFSNYDSPS